MFYLIAKRHQCFKKGVTYMQTSLPKSPSSGCESAPASVNLYAEAKRPALVLRQMTFSDLKDLHSKRRTPTHEFSPVLLFSEANMDVTLPVTFGLGDRMY